MTNNPPNDSPDNARWLERAEQIVECWELCTSTNIKAKDLRSLEKAIAYAFADVAAEASYVALEEAAELVYGNWTDYKTTAERIRALKSPPKPADDDRAGKKESDG